MTVQGNEAVGRPDGARFGDFEIRMTATGTTPATVSGTMGGTVIDFLGQIGPPGAVRVEISGSSSVDAVLTGTAISQVLPSGRTLQTMLGTMSGRFVYTHVQGAVTTCTSAEWNLASVEG
jgi:hypothetical protein